jgi:hypothetical protein
MIAIDVLERIWIKAILGYYSIGLERLREIVRNQSG